MEPMSFRPLHRGVRALLAVAGTISLALGVVGIYVPGLPTTPFLLLAAACYVRSSERMFRWLVAHPRLGPPVRSFLETRAVSLKIKVSSLILAWAVLGGLALFVVQSAFMKVLLISLGLAKTVFMLSIPTAHR